MKNIILRLSVAIFALIFISLSVNAQYRTDVFAITNARIITVSGAAIEKGTVVIRDGLIEAVGANVRVPADAKTIDGSGLSVYPGFFDAGSNLGIPVALPRQPGAQAQTTPVSNSNYPEGLQPEIKTFDQLKAGEDQFEAQRNTGITTALTVGSEGIFNGQSAVINLAGDSVPGMVVRTPFAQHVTFTTLRGGQYPGSLLGTFSAMRQMFLDAQRLIELQKLYTANPRGMRRPDADATLQALIPLLNGMMPVVFNANTEREIVRALDFAKEFNLKPIISGGQEAWRVANRLKQENVPVLLSLNFPERTTAEAKDADPEPLQLLRLRVEVPKNAARLKQAGVKFAFQSGGIRNLSRDFLGNAGKTAKNGLSKDDAIRAMTLSAAEILGVENRLGSIEEGKIANLVVVRGEIFDDTKKILHVFVDGRQFEQKETAAPPRPAASGAGTGAPLNVGGTYQINIEVPGQPLTGTLVLTQQTASLTGSMQTMLGTSPIKDGKVTADGFTFSATVEFQGQTFDIFVSGRVTGNQVEGTLTSPQGVIPFTGTKNP